MIDSIRRRSEFQLLRDAGRYRRSGPLGLRCVSPARDPDLPGDCVRVAFAIGRSVGGAVVRNRVRRQLRAILHDLDERGQLTAGQYLFIVSSGAVSLPFDELRTHVERLTGAAA